MTFGTGSFRENCDRTIFNLDRLFDILDQLDQSCLILSIDRDHITVSEKMPKPWHVEKLFFGYPSQMPGLQSFHTDNINNTLVIHDEHIRIGVSVTNLLHSASHQKNDYTIQVMYDGSLFTGK